MIAESAGTSSSYPFTQNVEGCLEGAIGPHGLSKVEFAGVLRRLEAPMAALVEDYRSRRSELLRISEAKSDIAQARAAVAKLSDGAKTLVFFGTGGSGLGGQTLAQVAGWNIPGLMQQGQRQRPRTRFYDNLDAGSLSAALAGLDLVRTRFVITSKSGSTVETLVQAVCAIEAMRKANLESAIGTSFLLITEPERTGRRNPLRDLFAPYGVAALDHPVGIGGRFSVLTMVGLVPALARGLDVEALRTGAGDVVQALTAARSPAAFAPAVGAAAAVGLREARGVSTQVMMPYADQLGRFSHWFVQLWAESLGKQGHGTTPVACLGPLDQHSQLQLFMDGPREHLITVLRHSNNGDGPTLPVDLTQRAGMDFLAGRPVADLVAAQAAAVPAALIRAGRPVRTIDLPGLDARTIGALLMHFMIETVLAARLMGIDPFDQPAVELAKSLTRESLMRRG